MTILALLALIGSLTAGNHHAGPKELTPNMNDFTFRFNRALTDEGSTGNQLISGLSAEMAFAMLAEGANRPSRATLDKLLGVGDLKAANKAVADQLTGAKGAEFTLANSIWSLADVRPSAEYQANLKSNYAAEFAHLNGTGPEDVKTINNWVSEHTKGRIPAILDRIDPAHRLFIINALTFDGKWKVPFETSMTHPREFKIGGKDAVNVPTMLMLDPKFPYAKLADGSRILKLAYEGDEFSTLLVLPPEDASATSAFKAMDETKFEAMLGSLKETKLRVQLPKLKMRESYDLDANSPSSKFLGIDPLFRDIDLGRIAPELARNTAIGQIKQLTYLEWDETGTRAAAATSIGMIATMMPVDPPQFIADRPFMFFLFHEKTKSIVFSGLVNDPRS